MNRKLERIAVSNVIGGQLVTKLAWRPETWEEPEFRDARLARMKERLLGIDPALKAELSAIKRLVL